jgi:nicotinate phosphoribosyltransferase
VRRSCSRPWCCRSSTTTRDRERRRPDGDRRRGRPLIEFGSRRTHEEAAVAAARAAYLAGFAGTSNLEAGRRYGVPTLGHGAHAFTLLFDDELARSRPRSRPRHGHDPAGRHLRHPETGIDRAIEAGAAARRHPDRLGRPVRRGRPNGTRATRRRSGTTGHEDRRVRRPRRVRDRRSGRTPRSTRTEWVRAGDRVGALRRPTFVYKLVAREAPGQGMISVAKDSPNKQTRGGHKTRMARSGRRRLCRRRVGPPGRGWSRRRTPLDRSDGCSRRASAQPWDRGHPRPPPAGGAGTARRRVRRLSDGPPCMPTEGPADE